MDTNLIAIIVGTNLIAILGVGIGVAGLVLRQGARLDRRIDALQEQMNHRFDTLQGQSAELRERVARIEGILTREPASAEQARRAQAGS